MPRGRVARLTRWFLYLLILSIAVGAMLAIVTILAGTWGWFETRVLLTSGTVAGGSMVGMACGAAMSRYRNVWLPAIGIALGLLGALLILIGMWVELDSADYWRAAASVSVFAVASAHVALLSLARLRLAHGWIQITAGGASLTFAGVLVAIFYSTHVETGTFQLLAVIGIVAAAFTLIVPIVHFLDRRAVQHLEPEIGSAGVPLEASPTLDVATIDAEIVQLQARIAELRELRRMAGHATSP